METELTKEGNWSHGGKDYQLYRNSTGFLELYCTTALDDQGHKAKMERIVTNAREVSELPAYFQKRPWPRFVKDPGQLTIE